jgi:hypothetical protein
MGIVRLQIEIEEEDMEELEQLRERGGLRTKKELLNNAFTLLKWAVRERQRGCSIVSANQEEHIYRELHMPFLEAFASEPVSSTRGRDTRPESQRQARRVR